MATLAVVHGVGGLPGDNLRYRREDGKGEDQGADLADVTVGKATAWGDGGCVHGWLNQLIPF
jgi:hypothetical protein